MKLQPRHIFLILGATTVIISFFYFVSAHSTYEILLSSGLTTAAFALIFIWLRDTVRMRVLWTAIALLFALIQQLMEESSIQQSARWMIQDNQEILQDVNSILITKPGNIILLKTEYRDNTALFSARESKKISYLFQKTDIKLISKDSAKVYYEVYGMLDARVGFSCSYAILCN
jgi:hypothetical protein